MAISSQFEVSQRFGVTYLCRINPFKSRFNIFQKSRYIIMHSKQTSFRTCSESLWYMRIAAYKIGLEKGLTAAFSWQRCNAITTWQQLFLSFFVSWSWITLKSMSFIEGFEDLRISWIYSDWIPRVQKTSYLATPTVDHARLSQQMSDIGPSTLRIWLNATWIGRMVGQQDMWNIEGQFDYYRQYSRKSPNCHREVW